MFDRFPEFKVFLAIFILVPFLLAASPQEAKVNQKKINREKQKQDKKAKKKYDDAIKKHNNNQSKETKSMMKQAKKDAPKNTPVHKKNALSHPGSKSCK